MNRPYNFRMPPNLTPQPYGMMSQPISAPAPERMMVQPMFTPAAGALGSSELSDPYLRELMRNYSPSAQPMAQPQSGSMTPPNEGGLKLDSYMQELIRRYQPSMPQMPAGLSPMPPSQPGQGNAFFTL